jgi:hypothetical protein
MNVVPDPARPPGSYVVDHKPAPPRDNRSVITAPGTPENPGSVTRAPVTKLIPTQPGTSGTFATATQKPTTEVENARIRYDHAKDFTWVMGKLEYLYSKRAWRVRYSPPEVEDQYGGTFTLVGVEDLSESFKSGQMVRVDGVVLDPETRQLSPKYQVHAIKPLE